MPEIYELDEAGKLTSTYVETINNEGKTRIDVIFPNDGKSPWQKLLDVFLPAGYPHSVTEDYLEYQIYDSLQAFASSIAGLLSNRAVLEGVGVGDASTTPNYAILLSILQEAAGRITTILFAHRLGKAIEPECKTYRLAADVFNDAAMVLDCLSPIFPRPFRVIVFSASSMLRSLCGVAAGSAKASLSAHFARWGNLGELNAKDASQETVISLLGMLAGSLVVSRITTPLATWASLIVLLVLHLMLNTLAVRAVCMRTLNRQRAGLVFQHLIAPKNASMGVPSPAHIAACEYIFYPSSTLFLPVSAVTASSTSKRLAKAHIGVPLITLLSSLAPANQATLSHFPRISISTLLEVFDSQNYILWPHPSTNTYLIILKRGCTPIDQIKAWWHACLLEHMRHQQREKQPVTKSEVKLETVSSAEDAVLERLRQSLEQLNSKFMEWVAELRVKGWDLDTAALETRTSVRIDVSGHSERAKKVDFEKYS
ncbi:DUF647 domain protein [Pseudovirgaria hyperparasitica]|uniref:DUF647 domain protein n=1 Tax=Pseudovirgaria hyperparasitica TaxID=470096 RepID=A0A6A6WAE2_9PEZI|nr:DUF647 domain protein [Pseudovirgaria hyperparasitica]KAF2759643.1 DUF647 domain protein [Pseudovirgaria hyperparasitica]